MWVSPDGDAHAEEIEGDSGDIAAVRWSESLRPYPPGVGRVYRFRAAPIERRMARWLEEAEDVAQEVFARRFPQADVPESVFDVFEPAGAASMRAAPAATAVGSAAPAATLRGRRGSRGGRG